MRSMVSWNIVIVFCIKLNFLLVHYQAVGLVITVALLESKFVSSFIWPKVLYFQLKPVDASILFDGGHSFVSYTSWYCDSLSV